MAHAETTLPPATHPSVRHLSHRIWRSRVISLGTLHTHNVCFLRVSFITNEMNKSTVQQLF